MPYDDLDEAIGQRQRRRAAARALRVQQGRRRRRGRAAADDLRRRLRQLCALSTARCPRCRFGGVGQSGSGRHHGVEGFREFSNPRGVFVRGEGDLIEAFLPPYGQVAEAIVSSVFNAAAQAAPATDG